MYKYAMEITQRPCTLIFEKCSSKILLWTILLMISMVFIYQKNLSRGKVPSPNVLNHKVITSTVISDIEKAIEIISRLRSKSTSLHGLKYRSMICTVVRNDPHLAEFLIRHLITGFSHIVVYDNNRILAGYDSNITTLLAPFVAVGVVTHVPWYQNVTDLLEDGFKNQNSVDCLAAYGKNADWVAVIDTDEYINYQTKTVSIGALNNLLLELEQNHLCGVTIRWTFMYGEAKMLKQNSTLLEAYPRVCGLHGSSKVLARPSEANFSIPHGVKCKKNSSTTKEWVSNENSKIVLIHYYSKSMEEYLAKADQSVGPAIRVPIKTYDLGPACTLIKVDYAEDYRRVFLNAFKQLEMVYRLTSPALMNSPSLSMKDMPDYSLFMYLKYRCAKRQEFDNDKYLSMNSDAKQAVENGTIVDGLYHFMDNYLKGVKGCWKTDTYSICE